jgi:hypothetical protein
MLVECGGKITRVVFATEWAGPVQGWYRDDLQQESDRGKHSTETPAVTAGLSVLLTLP